VGAFASASTGTGVEIVAPAASTNFVGIVVALALCIVNIAIIGLLAARWVRQRRRRTNETVEEVTTGAFRAEAGTIRSFNSLVSKFGPAVDPDSISTVSSIAS